MVQVSAEPETVTVLLQVLLHPFPFDTVTVYVPAPFALMQRVVAPVLHKYV
jgi:hypothetical protein